MYILDKNKDFYDHYSHIYGVDKSITFDRRGSINLTDQHLIEYGVEDLVRPRYRSERGALLLEVGNLQYLIYVTNILYDERAGTPIGKAISFDIKLLHTYSEHRHFFKPILSLRRLRLPYSFSWFPKRKHRKQDPEILSLEEAIRACNNDWEIPLPILANSKLTSILNPEEIWIELSNYISALKNDVDISIPMTDKAKADTHGFDKFSFRHPIKM
jgi:hypothetical protein